jgi:release factor glutamine methyltransferase
VTAPVRDQIGRARDAFVRAGVPSDEASLDAEVLARHVLGWDRARLLTEWHEDAPRSFEPAYASLISRRVAREPVALIVGHREFWGLEFYVSPAVLIPRPETELLVEQTVRGCGALRNPRVVDVGTGSGCIAVAVARELPAARVLAIDRSAAALAVARRNVDRHAVASRVQLVRANLLDSVGGPVDVIVSNPPYIALRDAATLQPEVARFEPQEALFAGEDGLEVLRVLSGTAKSRLAPNGRLIVEFGAGQSSAMRVIAEADGWTIEIAQDLAGIPRVAVMTLAADRRDE